MQGYTPKKDRRTERESVSPPTPIQASGIAFSIATVLPVLSSFVFLLVVGVFGSEESMQSDWFLYISYLLPQTSFAITAIWFLSRLKTPVKGVLTAQKCKPRYFLLAFTMQIGLFSLSELNGLFLQFLERFGYQDAGIALPNMDGFGFVGVLFTVALVPAVFEEIFFRGVLLKGLKKFGETGAVLLCGALFALYHQNPAQTVYQFCCGVAFALVAVRSGSILPTIASHFFNNALVLTLAKFGVTAFPTPVFVAVMLVSGACLIASLVWLFVVDKREKTSEDSTAEKTVEETESKTRFFPYASVGIAVCMLTWLAVFFSGVGGV